jgi:hypothetical protein
MAAPIIHTLSPDIVFYIALLGKTKTASSDRSGFHFQVLFYGTAVMFLSTLDGIKQKGSCLTKQPLPIKNPGVHEIPFNYHNK